MTTPVAFEEIKKKQHAVWNSGSYGKIAWLTVPLADPLCESVDLRSGSAVTWPVPVANVEVAPPPRPHQEAGSS